MRYLVEPIEQMFGESRHMAFVAGPRQVGKTTLAKDLLRRAHCEPNYFNWDIDADRRAIVRDPSGFPGIRATTVTPPPTRSRVALDEIHKYPRWKRLLKGLFDQQRDALEIIVTGSGRLDVYQRGGDSLFGRYDLFRLHPFTLGEHLRGGRQTVMSPDAFAEALGDGATPRGAEAALAEIERFGGFPEPLHSAREATFRRWRRMHRQLTIREDLRDLTRIRELGLVESLVTLLPERVGSPLSVNALAGDLGVAFNTVKLWLDALARLYFVFELRPFAGRLARTLRREGKTYLYDATEVRDGGARFENVVALHLRKICDAWTDLGFGDYELTYARDKEKREVDFLVTESNRPWMLLEAKLSDTAVAPALRYFAERMRPSHGAVQIVRAGANGARRSNGITVIGAAAALALI